jgi:hypothetical protein
VDLSIVIVNWNSAGFLRKCLASLFANVQGVSFEVLVLDNGSYDGSAQLVSCEFPTVRFYQSHQNLGFAKGNNLLVGHARGRTLLFLNADTEVLGDAVQQLVARMQSTPDIGALGPRLLNADGSTQASCIQAFPTILNQVADADWLRGLFPRWRLWGNRALLEDGASLAPVDGIVGACLMIDEAVFAGIGGFHEGFFMYAEDMDLCRRLRQAGRRNYYLGSARVIHHGGRSADRQSDGQFSAVVMRESLRHYMRIHRGPLYARLYQSSMALVALVRLAALGVAMLLPIGRNRRHSVGLASRKWLRVFRWAVGWEGWVQHQG